MAIETNFTEEVIDIVGSLTKTEKIEMSQALFKGSIEVTDLTKEHTVLTGVRHGNYVPIIDDQPNYESFPFSNPNQCAIPECDLSTNYSVEKWDLGLIECKVPICLREFDDEFLRFWNQYKMVQTDSEKNENEYMQSALIQFLYNKFKTNHLAAQWRGGYFGDKASSSPLFNGIDGWFTQAEATTSQIITIPENTGIDYAAQQLSGERIYEILLEMYKTYFTQSWFTTKPVEFRMSKWDAMTLTMYYNTLKDKKCCDGLQVIDPEQVSAAPLFDWQRLTFYGIPIKVMYIWDEVINKTTELNPGWDGSKIINPNAARVNPHRIILTYKDNLLLGTQERSNLSFFDIWYSKDQDKIFMKGGSYFGASIPEKDNYLLAI
ncbi:hypothetical protein D1632_10815 [Chryseobacterium nematophagum]|uniref:Uncharacterized protein n=1 Tax=Chryseobacterium nematophagum TaxID=2305228 RepID=A0A3M7LF17_9FLAO|nr:hypothetical protein [Chryseobacterium nematophagum]RMZ60072.1 hypothetical protein D1632_10815 [Chryseobacterium nematophagum]